MATQQQAIDWLTGGWKKSPYAKDAGGGVLAVDTDGKYGFQCKDFVNAYAIFLGHPFTGGNANALWDVPQDPFWQKIPATQQPQPGDVFVRRFVSGGTEFDHTGGIKVVDALGFLSTDQNWFNSSLDKGSPPASVYHLFDNEIRGYLRPKLEVEEMVDVNAARILSAFVLGNNGLRGTKDALAGQMDDELLATWVGKAYTFVLPAMYDSQQGKEWREWLYTQAGKGDGTAQATLDQIKKIIEG